MENKNVLIYSALGVLAIMIIAFTIYFIAESNNINNKKDITIKTSKTGGNIPEIVGTIGKLFML